MKLLDRFRFWIAQPLLDAMSDQLRAEHAAATTIRQMEAYELGKTTGRAIGQLEGQQILLGQMTQFLDERRAEVPEITAADIERAKKGLVH